MLDKTLGYILCCQSPGLFVLALLLLVLFLGGRSHKVKSFFRLLLCILCAGGGVALYFLGIYKEYFTIRDFFHIRPAGWVGLVIAAVIVVLTAVRAFFAAADARREQKAAARAENQRIAQEKEAEAKAAAEAEAKAAAEAEAEAEVPAPVQDTAAPETAQTSDTPEEAKTEETAV